MNTIAMRLWAVIATAGSVMLKIMDWLNQYRAEIDAAVLRIQKDSADGKWSNEEKVDHLWDLFQKKVYPNLDWKIKLFLKFKGEAGIKKMLLEYLEKLIEKSRALKAKSGVKANES